MPTWSLTQSPLYKTDAIATKRGWEDPITGEVLVCIKNLDVKGGSGDINKVVFGAASYSRNGNLSVKLSFNEKVSVSAGASIVITWSGGAGNQTLYATAQTNKSTITFDKQVDVVTNATVPNQAGTLSIAAQTIGGTIVDTNSAIAATGLLTFTDNPLNTETVTIDSKVYTFQSTLTNSNGNVKIGATLEQSISNLINAINLTGVAGTDYATATTLHTTVTGVSSTATTLSLKAKTAGTAGNSIATTETLSNGSFGGSTLSGGVADVATNKTLSAPIATAAGTRVVA